jgi:L-ascorbate metabolism protein UlaG (beta-lactamase superfamily)
VPPPAGAPLPAGLRWLGHAGVLLEGPPAVYIDPWRLEGRKGLPPAALVLVTHGHFDHASPEDIALVLGPGCVVAGPADALAGLPGAHRALRAGEEARLAGVRVTAYAAGDAEDGFHPPSRGLAYLVEGAGPSLLHLGDAGGAPVPRPARAPAVVAVPVAGGTVLSAEAAAEAAAATGAAAALPVHWGDLQGSWSDAARFLRHLGRHAPGMTALLPGGGA